MRNADNIMALVLAGLVLGYVANFVQAPAGFKVTMNVIAGVCLLFSAKEVVTWLRKR